MRDLRSHLGQEVTVYGWVNTLRLQRTIQFVLVRDHTGIVQLTHKRPEGDSALEEVIEHAMPIESAVKVTGTVVDNPVVNLGGPKLMGAASESGAEVFPVKYFERTAYLAQSPQFFKQMAIASGIDRVLEIGPVFRAEPSFTSWHATEFTGVDVEIAWIDSVADVMSFEERMLAHVLACVAQRHGEQIREHFATEIVVPSLPFPR